ncbi:MAG: TRAP transporter large permease subunit, partial [Verrucomicrobiae bacterium]|nr:TRAP transporter large permease subunit [Verrucomicrobiae bacterium]
ALDMVIFFLFWELGLVPMYFLIYLWGGENRRYAANKFFLYTMAGSLGLLFPPCLPLILYAIISTQAKVPVSIEAMFLGGLLPGIVMGGLTLWWGGRVGPRTKTDAPPFDLRVAWRAIRKAKWELLLPAVALGALFGGFATTVEAAAVTALYALVIEVVFYRDLHIWRDVPRVVTECGLLIGGILLILGVALGFTNYLVDAELPARLVQWTTALVQSRWVFLLLLNLFLIGVGCLMDIYSAIVVVVPLIVRLGREFGLDPVHLGIIFLANLQLGYLTPPVGMNLFIASYRFDKPLTQVTRAVLPMLAVFAVGVLLITYVPPLTTFLPRWLGR